MHDFFFFFGRQYNIMEDFKIPPQKTEDRWLAHPLVESIVIGLPNRVQKGHTRGRGMQVVS